MPKSSCAKPRALSGAMKKRKKTARPRSMSASHTLPILPHDLGGLESLYSSVDCRPSFFDAALYDWAMGRSEAE